MPDKNQKKPPGGGRSKQQKKKSGSESQDQIDSLLDAGSGFTPQ
jgi:hypothetical protein